MARSDNLFPSRVSHYPNAGFVRWIIYGNGCLCIVLRKGMHTFTLSLVYFVNTRMRTRAQAAQAVTLYTLTRASEHARSHTFYTHRMLSVSPPSSTRFPATCRVRNDVYSSRARQRALTRWRSKEPTILANDFEFREKFADLLKPVALIPTLTIVIVFMARFCAFKIAWRCSKCFFLFP